MKLKEIAIHTTYKHPLARFNRQTWCVREQYWSYLKNYDTKQWQKTIIEVDDNPSLINEGFELYEGYTNIAVVKRYFDIKEFLILPVGEKKRSLLELLHSSMLYIAEHYGWEKPPLLNAYQQCLETGIEYKFKVKNKDFKSPTKEFIGYVECLWDINSFNAKTLIFRKDGILLKEQILMDIDPYLAEFIYYSNCKWDDPYTFSLYSKEGKRWSVPILSIA